MAATTLFLFQTTALFSMIFLANLRNPVHFRIPTDPSLCERWCRTIIPPGRISRSCICDRIPWCNCGSFFIRRYDA